MTYISQQQQDRLDAVKELNPNAIYNYADGVFTWLDGTTPISDADIDAKVEEIKTTYDAKQYQRDRATAYPTIQEQLDMQYWDGINNTTTWKDAITKVKTDNPKS
jgi:hypothetical protein